MYQAVNEVAVQLTDAVTSNRSSEAASPNVEDPYHVTTDEVSAIRNVCVLHDHTIATIDDEIACMCFID